MQEVMWFYLQIQVTQRIIFAQEKHQLQILENINNCIPKNPQDDLPTPHALNPDKIRSDFDCTPKGIDFSKISGRTFVRYSLNF